MRSMIYLAGILVCIGTVTLSPASAPAQSVEKRLMRPATHTLPKRPRPLATAVPSRPRPTPALKPLLSAEETRQRRRIAKCKANGGEWFIVVRPVSLIASGSDVDELYGSIYAVAGNLGGSARNVHSNIRQVREGGRVKRPSSDLWWSPDNANVGRDGGQGLATITITMRGQVDQRARSNVGDGVSIYFAVKDEDDGRGGSNDERFVVTRPNTPGNAYRIATDMPSCEDSPNFSRAARITINTRSNGDNRLNLSVHVRWFRDTGI